MRQNRLATDQYCVFEAEGALWGVAAESVREVADSVQMVPIPESPPLLKGVCHLRTELLPVLDLCAVTGEGEAAEVNPGHMLVFNGTEGPWSLPITRALALQPLELSVSSGRSAAVEESSAVIGTATFRDEVLRVLDAAFLYRSAAETLDAHWSAGARPVTDSFGLQVP